MLEERPWHYESKIDGTHLFQTPGSGWVESLSDSGDGKPGEIPKSWGEVRASPSFLALKTYSDSAKGFRICSN